MTNTESAPRERIIKTALRLFYQQGYLATGINQIIAESQVAKATFYSHFSSKENLCVAYLQARHVIWMGWLKESVEQYETPAERVVGIFDFLKKWMADCDFRGCAFLNIASEVPELGSKIRSEVISHKNSLRKYIYKQIAVIQSTENRDGFDIQRTVDTIYVLLEGAIVSSQNYGQVWPIEVAQDAAKRVLAD